MDTTLTKNKNNKDMINFGYHKLYINGQLVDAKNKERSEVFCPATGEPIAPVFRVNSTQKH